MTAESHRDRWTALDNAGFRGLAFEEGKTYHLSLMARLAPGTTEPVKFDAAFVREDGTMEARTPFTIDSREWKEYKLDVKAVSTQTRGKFRLLLNGHKGTVDLDHISLFPEDTWKGRANGLRNDLAQAIADLKPKVFRFPGGCIVEGTTLDLAGLGKLPADCYAGAVLDETADGSTVIFKFVNLGKDPVPISLNIPGAADGTEVSVAGIKGELASKNDLADPERSRIEESTLKIRHRHPQRHAQPPCSFMVYRIPVK